MDCHESQEQSIRSAWQLSACHMACGLLVGVHGPKQSSETRVGLMDQAVQKCGHCILYECLL